MPVASAAGVQDALRLCLLAEMGVLQYLPRSRVAVVVPAVVVRERPVVEAPVRSVAVPARPAPVAMLADAPAGAGRRTLRFGGPADAWKGLRQHLLKGFGAVESHTAADVMFGGAGSLLTLPALGALAANPALKRQAWMALRALRRSA